MLQCGDAAGLPQQRRGSAATLNPNVESVYGGLPHFFLPVSLGGLKALNLRAIHELVWWMLGETRPFVLPLLAIASLPSEAGAVFRCVRSLDSSGCDDRRHDLHRFGVFA